jgi:hypothetical protein
MVPLTLLSHHYERASGFGPAGRPVLLYFFRFLDLVCNSIGVPMKPNFFRI